MRLKWNSINFLGSQDTSFKSPIADLPFLHFAGRQIMSSGFEQH